MPNPPARFTFLLDPELKQAFEKLCASQDITASQMMRQLIKAHLAAHGQLQQPQARRRLRREG
jgi:predicted transcriptional regulator